jgi:imidazolonepropionase-like amidohydrolase
VHHQARSGRRRDPRAAQSGRCNAQRKGRIEVGADADLLLLRQDSLALATAIAGGRVHEYPA